VLGCASCVSYRAKYDNNWQREKEISDPYYTIFLIGDAGNSGVGDKSEVFDHLKRDLDQSSERSATIMIGILMTEWGCVGRRCW